MTMKHTNTESHAISKAIELSIKEKTEVVVYKVRDSEEFRYVAYCDYALPDDWVISSYYMGEQTDFPFYVK
jgi:hypothetical protein